MIKKGILEFRSKLIHVVVFPELAITGYPPKDLLYRNNFVESNKECLNKIISACEGIAVIVGFVDNVYSTLYNAAALISNKELIGVQHKSNLPEYINIWGKDLCINCIG